MSKYREEENKDQISLAISKGAWSNFLPLY